MKGAACSSCGQLIVWAASATSGKPIPISAKAHPRGNVELEPNPDPREPPTAHMLGKSDRRVGHPPPSIRYVSHFADCPNAEQHRKPRGPTT